MIDTVVRETSITREERSNIRRKKKLNKWNRINNKMHN